MPRAALAGQGGPSFQQWWEPACRKGVGWQGCLSSLLNGLCPPPLQALELYYGQLGRRDSGTVGRESFRGRCSQGHNAKAADEGLGLCFLLGLGRLLG